MMTIWSIDQLVRIIYYQYLQVLYHTKNTNV